MKQRLLVSVRGPREAIQAARGGAHIADVEYPASALGTPYPLNIRSVRTALDRAGFKNIKISTNIGEKQLQRATACQAALGVSTAETDLLKFGLAEIPLEASIYLGRNIVRTVKHWYPKILAIPAVFIDKDMRRCFDPFEDGPKLVKAIKSDGLLLDTYNKSMGKGLLDYCSLDDIRYFANCLHKQDREAWIAGSITRDELCDLWKTKVDVICVRGAACKAGKGSERFGKVQSRIVAELIYTIPQ